TTLVPTFTVSMPGLKRKAPLLVVVMVTVVLGAGFGVGVDVGLGVGVGVGFGVGVGVGLGVAVGVDPVKVGEAVGEELPPIVDELPAVVGVTPEFTLFVPVSQAVTSSSNPNNAR
ncbi:MAG TPA: hypothetical protein VIY29_14750, partial [Ktedonobacteraceae bacterium]